MWLSYIGFALNLYLQVVMFSWLLRLRRLEFYEHEGVPCFEQTMAGTQSGSCAVWWVRSTCLPRLTTWNTLEPAGTCRGTCKVWWVRSTPLLQFPLEPAGTCGGTRTVWWVGSTRLLRFTTWNPLEPAAEPAQFGGYALRVCYGFISWSPLEPAGARGGTRTFSRTLYAKLKFHASPRDLFILLN